MSAVERVVVSRKTPGDGKLEISAALANVLGGDGASIQVRVADAPLPGAVVVMACTCAKAASSGAHEHYFVQCDSFRALPVGTELELSADHSRLEVVAASR